MRAVMRNDSCSPPGFLHPHFLHDAVFAGENNLNFASSGSGSEAGGMLEDAGNSAFLAGTNESNSYKQSGQQAYPRGFPQPQPVTLSSHPQSQGVPGRSSRTG
jgi:hypothetical protein